MLPVAKAVLDKDDIRRGEKIERRLAIPTRPTVLNLPNLKARPGH